MRTGDRLWMVLVLLAACDGGATVPPVPSAITAYAPAMQDAVTGAAVAVPPAVRVTDGGRRGISGLRVTFAVTEGGGTVTTQATTGKDGIAAASRWVMGPVAQENAVTASVAGLAPVVFLAMAAPGAPAALEKVGGDSQVVSLGAQLRDSLALRVADAFGNGVPGVPVNLAASAGELSTTRVTTGRDGTARVALALPARSGTYTVYASAANVASQVFRVTVAPGNGLLKISGDSTYARVLSWWPSRSLTVRVVDPLGRPVRGAHVSFALAPGTTGRYGIYGMASSSTITAEDGEATLSYWVLGQPGVNEMWVFSPGMNPVVFTAFGLDLCEPYPYTLFTSLEVHNGWMPCWTFGADHAEVFTTTLARPQCVEFRLSSNDFNAYLWVLDEQMRTLAEDDNSGGGANARLRVFLAAGTYRIAVGMPRLLWRTYILASTPLPEGEPCSL